MTLRYREWVHWNVTLGEKAVRLSVADHLGREYFIISPYASPDGRRWRERRDEALDVIAEAIGAGNEPGEVSIVGR